MIFKNYFSKLWHQAASRNNQKLALFLEKNPQAKVLDLGCDDGKLVKKRIGKYVGSSQIWGVDIDCRGLCVYESL